MEKKKEEGKVHKLGKREEEEEKTKVQKNYEEKGRDGKDELVRRVEGGEGEASGIKLSWWEMYMEEEEEGWK